MKLLGQILLVCVLISVLQALVAVIAIVIMLLLIWGLLFRTRETVGLLVLCLLIEALQVNPFVTIALIAVLFGVVLIARKKAVRVSEAKPGPMPLLPPHSPKTGSGDT